MIDSRSRAGTARVVLLVVALLGAATPPAWGQVLPAGGLGVDRFGPEEGLPGSYVPDLAVTDDGRLWMIASGRLTSFDGLAFEAHDLSRDDAWPSGGLVGIGAGRGDTLWVTVGERLVSVVRGRVQVRAEHHLILRDVWQEEDGRLLAWDDRGVVRLEPEGFERVMELEDGWNWGRLDPLPGVPLVRGDVWLQDPRDGTVRNAHAAWVVDPLPASRAWAEVADPETVLVTRERARPSRSPPSPAVPSAPSPRPPLGPRCWSTAGACSGSVSPGASRPTLPRPAS